MKALYWTVKKLVKVTFMFIGQEYCANTFKKNPALSFVLLFPLSMTLVIQSRTLRLISEIYLYTVEQYLYRERYLVGYFLRLLQYAALVTNKIVMNNIFLGYPRYAAVTLPSITREQQLALSCSSSTWAVRAWKRSTLRQQQKGLRKTTLPHLNPRKVSSLFIAK